MLLLAHRSPKAPVASTILGSTTWRQKIRSTPHRERRQRAPPRELCQWASTTHAECVQVASVQSHHTSTRCLRSRRLLRNLAAALPRPGPTTHTAPSDNSWLLPSCCDGGCPPRLRGRPSSSLSSQVRLCTQGQDPPRLCLLQAPTRDLETGHPKTRLHTDQRGHTLQAKGVHQFQEGNPSSTRHAALRCPDLYQARNGPRRRHDLLYN
mmetsp:Transcript_23658/g.62316  ORF Transcript_23658/g.62316 Transcript_23658/m.62316 type:complete len:209 (-) Transcript_23658:369-995(-)